jgi:hypothetical protein
MKKLDQDSNESNSTDVPIKKVSSYCYVLKINIKKDH